jgi:hypothetical protein
MRTVVYSEARENLKAVLEAGGGETPDLIQP